MVGPSEAEDVVQKVLKKLVESGELIKPEDAARIMRRRVRNESVNTLIARNAKKRDVRKTEAFDERGSRSSVPSAEVLLNFERRIDIFLARLSIQQLEIFSFAVQGMKQVSIAHRVGLSAPGVNRHMTKIRQLYKTIVMGSDDPPEPPKPTRSWRARKQEKLEDRLRRDLHNLATGSSKITSQTQPGERAVFLGRVLFNLSRGIDEPALVRLPTFPSVDKQLKPCAAVISKGTHEPGSEVFTRRRDSGRLARALRTQDICVLAYILRSLRSLPRI